jgi:hypothetical protein
VKMLTNPMNFFYHFIYIVKNNYGGRSQVVRQGTVTPSFAGSSPVVHLSFA